MAFDDDAVGECVESAPFHLAKIRALATTAQPPRPQESGPLARALRRLHRDDPRHPRGLVYYDDTA